MTVRLAIAGAGLIGLRHAQAMAQAPGVRLAALIDPAPSDAARALAAAAGVPLLPDLDALPPDAADGVILATPNAAHAAGALACIARGLPVLVEKPIATTVAEARQMVDAARAAGVVLAVGHHRRHNPTIAAAQAMIAQGAIGRVLTVHAQFWLKKPDAYFDTPWRRQPGAGPVMVNLIHDIDLIRHLVGEVASVQAMTANTLRGHAVEDSCTVLLGFANGALGTASVSDAVPAPWSWELTAAENPAYAPTGESCYLIGGTEGSLDLPRLRLWRHDGGGDWWSPISAQVAPRPAGDPLVRQIEQFARAILGQEPPLVPGIEGLRTLAVIEAVQTAAREGRPVTPDA